LSGEGSVRTLTDIQGRLRAECRGERLKFAAGDADNGSADLH